MRGVLISWNATKRLQRNYAFTKSFGLNIIFDTQIYTYRQRNANIKLLCINKRYE
jgi:hypothetical protein